MKLYVLLSVMVLCLTGCDTEEIKNQVSNEIENVIDENKDIIKDKVIYAEDNIYRLMMANALFSSSSMISRSPGPLSLIPQRCRTP